MDPFTNSLNSQMQMLGIVGNSQETDDAAQALSKLSLQMGNNFSMKLVSNNNDTTNSTERELPNDINSLKNLLALRIRYTRPKQGGYWEFNDVPNDVKFLQDSIKFIDKHCISEGEYQVQQKFAGIPAKSNSYNKYLLPLEMEPKELDLEFGTRFYNHFSYKYLREQLIELVKSSKYDYLANIIESHRLKGQSIPESWIIYPGNRSLTEIDYIKFYDIMDLKFKEWILEYCLSNKFIRDLCLVNSELTTFETLRLIVNNQDISFQIKLLIDILIENSGSDDYLVETNGFLPYLTYVEHLQHAIISSIPNCENPWRTSMLLVLIIRGMIKFPLLLSEFQVKLHEFLIKYPDFTLGQLADFLRQNNMPNLDNIQRIMN